MRRLQIYLKIKEVDDLIDATQQLQEYGRQALKGMYDMPEDDPAVQEIENDIQKWSTLELNLREQKEQQL